MKLLIEPVALQSIKTRGPIGDDRVGSRPSKRHSWRCRLCAEGRHPGHDRRLMTTGCKQLERVEKRYGGSRR